MLTATWPSNLFSMDHTYTALALVAATLGTVSLLSGGRRAMMSTRSSLFYDSRASCLQVSAARPTIPYGRDDERLPS